MKYTVYLRTNKVNGKKYVGQTSNIKQRERQWKCLKWYYANKRLTVDRNKFGLENFELEILFESEDQTEANKKEIEYIEKYNTLYPHGYNITTGGKNGYKFQEEIAKERGANMLGENNYWYGKTFSEDHRKKIADGNRGKKMSDEFKKHMSEIMRGEGNHRYGTKHTSEWKSNMSKLMTGRKMPQEAIEKTAMAKWKPVIQIKEDKTIIEYNCIKDVAENGYYRSSVSEACRGIYLREGNRVYKNSEWYWKSDYEKMLEDLASQQLN